MMLIVLNYLVVFIEDLENSSLFIVKIEHLYSSELEPIRTPERGSNLLTNDLV